MPSKLEQLQLQFRQKLMQEKEERMIKIHTDSQQKALSKVTKYDSSPAVAVPATIGSTITRKPSSISTSPLQQSPTKKGSPGVDRSRPLPPISRDHQSKNYHQATRSHNSSAPSESSMRVSIQNGVRARSMDSEVANGGTAKINNSRPTQPSELFRSPYAQSHQGRRSPETETWSHKHFQKSYVNSKPNYDAVPKVSNGHLAQAYGKSSTEQRTMAGNSYKPQPTTAAARGKPKTTVTNLSKKPTNVSSKPRNTTDVPVRKPPNPNQDQCRYCGRNFNKDRIEKHVSICSKSSQKKVKVFDMTKMRVKGTEAESYLRKGVIATSDPPKPKKSNWKKQHEEFINAIRQAKVAQRHLAAGGKLSDLPPPPPSDTSDYVPCPYCGRKFNEGAAQRHIPKCKNILSNKKAPIKKK